MKSRLSQRYRSQSQTKIHIKTQSSSTTEEERIVINKHELVEFTKRFAIHKLEYEDTIASLKVQIEQKNQIIGHFNKKNEELQQYIQILEEKLKQSIQENEKFQDCLKETYENKINEYIQCMSLAEADLRKTKEKLSYSEDENSRYRQFLKIKEQIIANLQWEKNHRTPLTSLNSTSNISPIKNKTIVIRKKAKVAATEQENKIFLQNQGQITFDSKVNEEQKKIKKKIEKTYSTNEKLLSEKCMFLEKHIQKLNNRVQQYRRQSAEMQCICGDKHEIEESIVEDKILIRN